MAVNYSPDEVQFILIDYKGGGINESLSYKGRSLPHVVAALNNIDESPFERLIIAISKECKRRQGLFNQLSRISGSNVSNIDDYLKEQLGGSWELTTKDNVYWHDMFNTSNCYESADVESLGIYKGAYTYPFAFCRPTEDANKSIMNNNNGIFNAISRRQIYYRIHCLAGENIGSFFNHDEYEKFLEWDSSVFIPTLSAQTRAGNDFSVIPANQPLDPPVWQEGTWLNGHFIPND